MKATVANIPVGSYDGGGRGKDREREKERERDVPANSHFSFEPEATEKTASPSAHCAEEPPSSDRPLEGSSASDYAEVRIKEITKEVRGLGLG